MPESHNELIRQIISVNENVTVVLMNGAPVEMPWIGGVKGVLEAYLGGQAGSGAIIDILYGEINPSGKLAETFPVKLEDTPSYRYFPGYTRTVEYREGIYIGYRYYDKFEKNVLFPFGYGLSYTKFSYTDMKVLKTGQYEYAVSLKLSNTGETAGAEVVQLYMESPETGIYKAKKELKGFEKVYLEPGETKTVTMNLNKRSFAFYNINIPGWHVEKGDYRILVGASSRDISMDACIALEASSETEVPDYSKSAPEYYRMSGDIFEISEEQFKVILGRNLPEREFIPGDKFTENSMLVQTTSKWIGRLLLKMVNKQVRNMISESEGKDVSSAVIMMESVVREMPLRAIGMMGGDRLPRFFTQGFVEILNGRLLKGAKLLLKK
ncbi:MAG: glycoside hydrolase family 3 C-terminal domain-containing protein, partial [Clostridia bacterium]|nr:glycoside hydrolase family 3 C-terminal domain-containing protein [Clostridia bacterium]